MVTTTTHTTPVCTPKDLADLKSNLKNYEQFSTEYDTQYIELISHYLTLNTLEEGDSKRIFNKNLLKTQQEELHEKIKKLEETKTAIEDGKKLCLANIIELLKTTDNIFLQTDSLEQIIDKIPDFSKEIARAKKKEYSSKGKFKSVFHNNLFLKKKVALLLICIILIVSIVTFLIFK